MCHTIKIDFFAAMIINQITNKYLISMEEIGHIIEEHKRNQCLFVSKYKKFRELIRAKYYSQQLAQPPAKNRDNLPWYKKEIEYDINESCKELRDILVIFLGMQYIHNSTGSIGWLEYLTNDCKDDTDWSKILRDKCVDIIHQHIYRDINNDYFAPLPPFDAVESFTIEMIKEIEEEDSKYLTQKIFDYHYFRCISLAINAYNSFSSEKYTVRVAVLHQLFRLDLTELVECFFGIDFTLIGNYCCIYNMVSVAQQKCVRDGTHWTVKFREELTNEIEGFITDSINKQMRHELKK